MGEDHQGVAGRVAARGEHAAAQDDGPGVAHHAPLAGELAEQRRHHLLACAGAGLVHGAQPALDHVEGQREIVAHDRVDDDVGGAAGGVDGAVAGGDRGEARLERAQGELVAPVDTLLVGGIGARRLPARSGPGRRRSRRADLRRRGPAPRSAPGSQAELASEKATISPAASATAASCARILPPRGSSSTRSAPAARARSAVASLQPSQATISCKRSRG